MDWGHGARRAASKPNTQDHVLLSKFKLYLDENLHLEPLPNSLNVVEVIGDYLRAFHGHVTSELQKGFAGNYDPTKFRYVSIRKKGGSFKSFDRESARLRLGLCIN